ncbi:alpha/beta fold hydrolase [Tenacibaculum singaporense]|uniref:alpha/beta fold hydrolase n=1 Tax=Tenacibaculum singaporense TaxID=2358479 RepID=UPI000F6922A1|nr:alpha/beta fold hydrolase [Tenacibaculum singaporense]RSC92868.1 alpha/beta hydrolase [Tenacibaculum singaporense]
MKKILFILFLNGINAFGQTNFLDQIELHKFKHNKLGKIEVGVFKSEIKPNKPLVLILGGSGFEPTFKYNLSDKQVYCSGFWGFTKFKKDFHIAYINKAGIPLYDSISNNNSVYKISDIAIKNNTLDWRAESASYAISELRKKFNPTKVYVIGHSQGGQVAPKVAVLNKYVDKVVMMSSNALDHIYDRILITRQKALNNLMTQDEAQYVVDSLFNVQRDIYKNPNSLEKKFWGESFNKWYSYSKATPLESMLLLDIPILLIASGRDVEGSYIANTDYAMLEFIRKGKDNLTYKVYPNYDHIYMETQWKFGEEIGKGFKANEVIKDVIKWIKNDMDK